MVRPVDDPVWDLIYPPNGWRCRCWIEQMSQRDLNRYGHEVSPPVKLKMRPHRNARTGEKVEVPDGVHPAFAYNPGAAALPVADPARYDSAALGHEAAWLSVRSRDFERLLSGEVKGSLAVGHLDKETAARTGADVRRVDLSAEAVAQHRRLRPDLSIDDYRALPEIIGRGEIMRGEDSEWLFLSDNGTPHVATIRRGGDGKAMTVTDLRRATEDEIAALRRRAGVK